MTWISDTKFTLHINIVQYQYWMQFLLIISLASFWISRSIHSKLKLASGSSSSLTDLSQAKTPTGGGGEKGGTTGGLAEEFSKDKGTQQRRAGANATWNRLVWERERERYWNVCSASVLSVSYAGSLSDCENVVFGRPCVPTQALVLMFTHTCPRVCLWMPFSLAMPC